MTLGKSFLPKPQKPTCKDRVGLIPPEPSGFGLGDKISPGRSPETPLLESLCLFSTLGFMGEISFK